ncbi:MAG: histidine phosphatase family protein [Planctomyces sp.]|nr:histidine phosphatase family protein [Planctomyces sp.]
MSHVLIRSGETDFDVEGRLQGALDLPLTPRGRADVDAAIEELRSLPLETIYSSAGEPAFSTARVIGRALNVPVRTAPEFDNMHFGLWQGLCLEELRRKQSRVFKQWQENPGAICPPEGETFDDVYSRVAAGLKKPLRRGDPFAVVAAEPLATLVGCLLRGEQPRLGRPGERPASLVEVIEPVGVADSDSRLQNTRILRGLTFGFL